MNGLNTVAYSDFQEFRHFSLCKIRASAVPETNEILDVVDASDRVTGQAPRNEVHAHKLRHRAVHIFLFNERTELFIQKRAAGKDTFPRRYDSSASGHVASGETYDACALRELREELGLKVTRSRLQKHFKIESCEETGWEFVWAYSLRSGEAPRVNPQEIECGAFWPVPEVRARIVAQPEEFAPSFAAIFEEFDRHQLLPDQPARRVPPRP